MMDNILLLCDSYKISHYKQYPPGTSEVFCYFESRGGRFPYTVFFGLQYILKRYFVGKVVTKEKIEQAKAFWSLHMPNVDFNDEGWLHILKHHDGHLPVRISAVAEGSVVPVRNVLFTVVNTDPKCFWLPGLLETILVQTWYPMTVATNSRIQKQIIVHYLTKTHDNLNSLSFKLNDFGFRGSTSIEAAALGGAAHLVNFQGSDTAPAVLMLQQFYSHPMAGFTIPASEHSTITAWGKEGELEAFKNILQQFPEGIVACVSDSYSIWDAIETLWGQKLKAEVVKRGEKGGVLVVRPDSGDPPTVVLKCLELMGKAFGTEKNSKGYKMLPPYLRLIQGDGVSYKSLSKILKTLEENGWSAENVAFGSGGALLQKVDRDTQKCAYKCSEICVNGEYRDVYKEPITDPGKVSKKGRLQLQLVDGQYKTVSCRGDALNQHPENLLIPVFENGKLLKDWTFDEIRERAQISEKDIDILEFLAQDLAK